MRYTEKLDNAVRNSSSHVVVGMDPELSKIPKLFHDSDNPVLEFNKHIIRATKDQVAGYKFNIAFYEFLEEKGLQALRQSLAEIPGHLITICDAKRGDIANTTELYAKTYFDSYDFDAVTANAYMGRDSLEPFLSRDGKLVYLLALTSNPGSREFQMADCGSMKFYEKIISESLTWEPSGKTGYVFGANYCNELGNFTSRYPDVPLLIPGIGAQGNELQPLLDNLHTNRFLINSSRAIIYSSSTDCSLRDFAGSVTDAVSSLNKEINSMHEQ